ncbi:MAG: indole-3-glycerol-phosphate synthase [Methanoregulaceae archaeon]|nr:indole-3-glycerol-phosphate synthase [Methanoregulaceae archaeon]
MILDDILKSTEARVSRIEMKQDYDPGLGLCRLSDAIRCTVGKNAVIAELKYASPSSGSFSLSKNPEFMAKELISAGCIGLSVLTEPYFFGGSTKMLEQIRRVAPVPILRKDFIIDERQIYETRALGADAILLIAKILGDRLPSFVDLSRSIGLEPLVEVHTPGEVDLALLSGATLCGINNRDLESMKINLNTTRQLSPRLRSEGCLVVSMSGIREPQDIRYLKADGDAFLIGSAIMQSRNPELSLEEFVCA